MKRRIRRLAAALTALGLAAGLTASATGIAFAEIVPPSGGWAEIYNPYLNAQGNTLCLDDPGGSDAVNQPMQLWRCHGYASNGTMERWVFVPYRNYNGDPVRDPDSGDLVYELVNLAANECLAPPPLFGEQMFLEPCWGSVPPDTWTLRPDNAVSQNGLDFQIVGYYRPFDDECVSASNFTDNSGTRLVLEPCSPYDTSQIWNLG